jgi:hypothetical protein
MTDVQRAITRLLTPSGPTTAHGDVSAEQLYRATVRERRTSVDPETAEHIRRCLAEGAARELG